MFKLLGLLALGLLASAPVPALARPLDLVSPASLGYSTPLTFGGATSVDGTTDGYLLLKNAAGTAFTAIRFGGVTSSFPEIKRNSTALNFRLADDSADAAITTAAITASGTIAAVAITASGVITAANSVILSEGRLASIVAPTDSTAKTTLYTVPATKTAVITKVVFRSATGVLIAAVCGVGFNAGATDVILAAAHADMVDATIYNVLFPIAGAKVGAAADVLGVKCATPNILASDITVDVYGYLY